MNRKEIQYIFYKSFWVYSIIIKNIYKCNYKCVVLFFMNCNVCISIAHKQSRIKKKKNKKTDEWLCSRTSFMDFPNFPETTECIIGESGREKNTRMVKWLYTYKNEFVKLYASVVVIYCHKVNVKRWSMLKTSENAWQNGKHTK